MHKQLINSFGITKQFLKNTKLNYSVQCKNTFFKMKNSIIINK